MLPPAALRVLDLGAGTGKLTRQLVERGLDVMAVEPLAGMRGELTRVLPGVPVREGTAEAIPLPDQSVDAVLVAQAWHWVDPARAVPEVARVLRPGGTLGLVWNSRDERVPWLVELGRIMDPTREASGDFDEFSESRVGPPFGAIEELRTEWVHSADLDAILDMVMSRSYIILLPDDERRALLERVRDLVTTHPDVGGRDPIPVHYVTTAFRTQLPSG